MLASTPSSSLDRAIAFLGAKLLGNSDRVNRQKRCWLLPITVFRCFPKGGTSTNVFTIVASFTYDSQGDERENAEKIGRLFSVFLFWEL